MSAPIIIGHGQEAVYCYYYPTYYYQARRNGQSVWPCKIGWSRHSAITRIQQQVATSSPETPVIGLIIHTDHGRKLEQALHAILRLFDQDLIGATGNEWFQTNPDEIQQLCQLLRQI